jgi:hypothetical protein
MTYVYTAKRAPSLDSAIKALAPNASFRTADGVAEWESLDIPRPTDAEIQAELARQWALYNRMEYQDKRAAEYPPMTDYIDGVVKGDQAQIDAYIAACKAVKEKYPKPE